jgi:uncharacterized protein YceH (UPF0502 family)
MWHAAAWRIVMRPRPLDPVEIRILGCLVEKESTTPDAYPLTLKALTAACNQRSNRDPVMDLTETDVRQGLDRLHAEVLVWPVSGARVDRWRHALTRSLELSDAGRAVLGVLMLRGPQTIGELRGRSDRMHHFAELTDVEAALDSLTSGEEPLVTRLGRRPGQKEARWAHLLGGDVEDDMGIEESRPVRPAPSRIEERLAAVEARLERIERHLGLD